MAIVFPPVLSLGYFIICAAGTFGLIIFMITWLSYTLFLSEPDYLEETKLCEMIWDIHRQHQLQALKTDNTKHQSPLTLGMAINRPGTPPQYASPSPSPSPPYQPQPQQQPQPSPYAAYGAVNYLIAPPQ